MKYTTLIVTLLLVLFALPLVSASVSVADVNLDVSQAVERSNPIPERSDNLLDDSDELAYVTFSIPVTATGQAETVTSVTPNLNGFVYDSFGGSIDASAKYKVDTSLPLNIPAGATQNVIVRVLVPSNLDAIDSNYNRVKHQISASVVTSAGTFNPTLSFYAENNLQLKKVRLIQGSDTYKCSVDQDSKSLDCDSDIDKLRVGESFELEFVIKNAFRDKSELDLNGIDISIDSDNSDVDPSDDSLDEDIDTNTDDTFSISFDVDDSIDDGDDARITLEADIEDDNGARHGFSHDFTIEFNTADYDMATPILSLNPSSVCPGENVIVKYTLENLGSKKQSNVRPVLLNDALDLNKILPTISLDREGDRDSEYIGTFSMAVPSSARAGASYPIQLQVYYKDEDSSDALQYVTASLNVKTCVDGVPVNTNTGSTNTGSTNGNTNTASQTGGLVVVQPGQGTSATNGGQTTPTTGGASVPVRAVVADNSDTPFLVGLTVGLVVLLVLVGLLIATLRKN